jgi:hypothetical protein
MASSDLFHNGYGPNSIRYNNMSQSDLNNNHKHEYTHSICSSINNDKVTINPKYKLENPYAHQPSPLSPKYDNHNSLLKKDITIHNTQQNKGIICMNSISNCTTAEPEYVNDMCSLLHIDYGPEYTCEDYSFLIYDRYALLFMTDMWNPLFLW